MRLRLRLDNKEAVEKVASVLQQEGSSAEFVSQVTGTSS